VNFRADVTVELLRLAACFKA